MFVSRAAPRSTTARRRSAARQTARSLGQVAMAFGPPMVRERVGRTVADARRTVEGLLGSPAADGGSRASPTPGRAPAPAPTGDGEPPAPAPGTRAGREPVARARVDVGSSETNGGPLGNGDAPRARAPDPRLRRLSASQVVRAAHRAQRRRARRRCTRTRRPTGSAARSSARSNSSPASRPVEPARAAEPSDSPCSSILGARAARRDPRAARGKLWATREARPEPHEDIARRVARPRRRVDRRGHDRRNDRRVRHGRDRDVARRHPARRDRRSVRRAGGAGGGGRGVDRRPDRGVLRGGGCIGIDAPRSPAPGPRRTSSSAPASPPARS